MTIAPERIYLDNAATSWPKPTVVYDAVDRFQRENGAPAGRSVYGEAIQTQQIVDQTRDRVAKFFGAKTSQFVAFAENGTGALNAAIHGLLRPGDHVVTSVAEHNSVLRPLRFLESQHGILLSVVPCDQDGVISIDELRQSLRPETRLVALTHVSNVTGALQPVAAVGDLLQDRAALFLLDAAQSAGHRSVRLDEVGCNLIASPGHKGLLGPMGTGLLVFDELAAEALTSTKQGGTGTRSESDQQPASLPDRLESGSLNVPGIAGLGAALKFIEERSIPSIESQLHELGEQLFAGLRQVSGVTIHAPRDARLRSGVVSFDIDGYDPQEVATILDTNYRIQGRSGLHCAPRMHESLGTLDSGGTMRLSLGAFNDESHVSAAIAAVSEIAS